MYAILKYKKINENWNRSKAYHHMKAYLFSVYIARIEILNCETDRS